MMRSQRTTKFGFLAQLILLLAATVVFTEPALAQKSSAKSGYFPDCYAGDIFTGTLAAVDDAKSDITMTYLDPKHNNVVTLLGEIKQGYSVESRKEPTVHQLRPSELTVGKTYTAYYCGYPQKINGEKKTIYKIFLIDGVPNRTMGSLIYKAF